MPASDSKLRAAGDRGLRIWSEIELASRLLTVPIVAITGTNGKSTTTTLVGAALAGAGKRVFVGGNLGRPLVDAVDEAIDVAVAEVSSFQLEWVDAFRPAVGAVLNVTADHLDRHPSFEVYRELKGRVFARQTADDVAVVNRDDRNAAGLATGVASRAVFFGRHPLETDATIGHDAITLRYEDEGEGECYALARTALRGAHNAENIAAAALIARAAGASPQAVQIAIDSAEPLPHRLALVREHRGVRWYDDSKATNVGAVVKSLATFDAPVVLVAGGTDKGGDYAPLAEAARNKTKLTLLIGEARDRLAAALAAAGVPSEAVETLEAAVGRAAQVAESGDVVLLAPACASFDMFPDYAARGRAFETAVKEMP